MEEIQKKSKKVSTTNKEPKKTKTTTTTKETKKRTTKKEPETTKVSKAKKETKVVTKEKKATTTKKSTTAKEVKTASTKSTKKETKPVKKNSTKKEPRLTITPTKKETQEKVNNPAKKEIKATIKNSTPQKKYIDISVGAIICTLIIVSLLVFNIKLGIRAYEVITKKETTNTSLEVEDNVSIAQEVGTILDSENKIVSEIIEKIIFPQNVTASIYNKESFNMNTIPNDLKLMIGWAKTRSEDKLKSINENNEQVEAMKEETMEESLENIFGTKVKYKHESFENTNISTFSTHCHNQGKIKYKDGLYTNIATEQTENGIAPIIYQEIQKVVKYSETIIVYAKVAYMDVEGEKYIVYKDFDQEQFEEKLLEIDSQEIVKDENANLYTGEGTITLEENTALDNIRAKLNTYKYTFTLDQETGEYYLSKFNKSLSE